MPSGSPISGAHQAILAGEEAVRAACAGENGKMVGFIRESTSPYRVRTTLIDVNDVMLVEKKIIRKELDGLKVLGNGELTKKLTVKAVKFTGSAKEKIEAVGGTAEVI